jgi:GNAT superfamily N-acetyltransferase
MTMEDLAFADSLRAAAGWNQTPQDWQRFLQCAPDGCFIAERDAAPAGTATTTCYGQKLGWIGMLLVDPRRRGSGIGSALLHQCLTHLDSRRARCVKLDATPLGQKLYERFGFKAERSLTRWENPTPETRPFKSSKLPPSLAAIDLEAVVALDRKAFGVDRAQVLMAVVQRAVHGILHLAAPGKADGYGLLREGSRAWYLGPVTAEHPDVAEEIIRHLLAQAGNRAVFWDALDANTPATSLARSLGFKPQRPLLRMFRGDDPGGGEFELQFAIVDPAVG